MGPSNHRGQALIELILVLVLFLTCILIVSGGLRRAAHVSTQTGFESYRK